MARLTRDDWVRAAMREMAAHGADAVKVEALARALEVSKGSFYHHFGKRSDLLEALLEHWEAQGTEDVIRGVESAATDPAGRLRALMQRVFGAELEYDVFESQLRAWARRDPMAQAVVARVDERRVGFVADLLVAHGLKRKAARERSRILYRALVGDFVIRSHGGDALGKRELDTLFQLLIG